MFLQHIVYDMIILMTDSHIPLFSYSVMLRTTLRFFFHLEDMYFAVNENLLETILVKNISRVFLISSVNLIRG